MKSISLLICLAFVGTWGASNSIAQTPDNLVLFTGTLVNSRTGDALPNLNVSYKRLPYESEIGDFTTDSEGKFTAYFRASEKYSVLIENSGFVKYTAVIDPLEGASDDLVVNRTFKILEGGVGTVMKLDHLKFALSKATILEESHAELDDLAKMLNESSDIHVRLEGHTDYVGNPTANINLSQARVDAVKKYLTDKGISDSRIETKAFGGSQPLVQSSSSAARAVNRRVEVRIIGNGTAAN
jgi:outer membrane protein OmpA-like peptidoglycan-associated protein